MPTVAEIAADLDAFAPTATAAEWDNVGLLLGDPSGNVTRALTCLTLTPEVAAEAVAARAQLIVTHHPILFRGVKRLTTATADGRTLLALAAAGVAVYSPHTAFDNCAGGINDLLAAKLGLTGVRPLRPHDAGRSCKLVTFVPDGDLAKVSDALFAAGAGRIGEYHECSYRLQGTGTFFASDATNPTVGERGQRSEVAEWRLEVVCPESAVERVVAAMRSAHSYEEPAFDVYPLRPVRGASGEGRVGRLEKARPLGDVVRDLRAALHCGPVQVVGDLAKSVSTAAVACGAAGEFLADAAWAKADLFVTGEMRFHDYLSAQGQGVALALPGHYATERFGMEALAERLAVRWPGVAATASAAERDPVTWV